MDNQFIILMIQICALVASYFIGKYIGNKSPENIQDITAKVNLIIKYADKFVSWAKYFMNDSSGEEKMTEVTKQLKIIADRYNLNITDNEIKAIVQKAYDQMKNEEQK